jgi:hypothetical protein
LCDRSIPQHRARNQRKITAARGDAIACGKASKSSIPECISGLQFAFGLWAPNGSMAFAD